MKRKIKNETKIKGFKAVLSSSLLFLGCLFIWFVWANFTFSFESLFPWAKAAITKQINYQGKLTNSSSWAVPDGSYDMRFKIYDASSNGNLLWTGTHTAANGNAVSVTNGIFSVQLGSGTGNTLNLDFSGTSGYWLQVEIYNSGTSSWETFSPRKSMVSVPQAINANNVIGDGRIDVNTTDNTNAALKVVQNGTGDIVNVMDGANSAFKILDGGNVGINTAGPDRKLDVLDATNPQLRLTQADGTVYTDFQTNSSGYLNIAASGSRVGIGNASPASALDVTGTITSTGLTVNGTAKANLLDWNSIVAVFGQRQAKINELTDVLYQADKRFTVTNGAANYFDGNYDSSTALPANATTTININVAGQAGIPAPGITYPQGSVYVSFYYTSNQYTSISMRVKENGVWYDLAAPTNIATSTSTLKVMQFTVPASANYLTDLELTIVTDGTHQVNVAEINYVADRWTTELELPYVSKYLTSNYMFGNFGVKTNTGVVNNLLSGTSNSYLGASTGSVGVGTTGPDRKLDVLDATNPQLRLSQADGTQYVDFQADASSNLTIIPNGGDVILSNAATELKIKESAGDTYYGILDVGDLSADATYTFSGTSGTVLTSANYTSSLDSAYVNVGGDTMSGGLTFSGVTDDIVTGTNEDLALMPNGSGKVGVGTNSPNEKLTVEGNLSLLEADAAPANTAGYSKIYSKKSGIDSYSKLLLHAEGAGNSFVDSSPSNQTITASGNATQSSTQKKFGNSSAYFDGVGDYLSSPDSEDWNFGTGNFTIDLWVRPNNTTGNKDIMSQRSASYGAFIVYQAGASYQFYASSNGSSWSISGGQSLGTAVANTWTHLAVVRSGNNFYCFQDGTQTSTWTSSASFYNDANSLHLGSNAGTEDFAGYLDEVRISKGVARWTSNFTPPAAAYSANGVMYFKNGNGDESQISGWTINTGNGLAGGPITSAGGTVALGALTSDWTQSGAYDIVLSNASSEIKIKESAGDTYYGTLEVGDLAADATYTFSGSSGTVLTSSNFATSLDSTYVNVAGDTMTGSLNFSGVTSDITTATNENLALMPNGTGNVGINTTGPDRRLDVLDATNPQLRLTQADGSVYTDLQTTSVGELYINPSGSNVGIGTNDPSSRLSVVYDNASTTYGVFSVGNGAAQGGNIATMARIGGQINPSLGAIGLDIEPNISNTTGYDFRGIYIQQTVGAAATVSGKTVGLYIDNPTVTGTSATRYSIYSANTDQSYFAGNVGIGTVSPTQALTVKGDIALMDTNNRGYSRIGVADNMASATDARWLFRNGTDTNAALRMVSNSANYFSIDAVQANDSATTKNLVVNPNGGYVGIGASSPNEKLEVTGNIRTSGVYKIGTQQVLSLGAGSLTGNLIVGNGGGSLTHGSGSEGYYNTAVGVNTGNGLTTGLDNTLLGYSAGGGVSTGNFNTLVGMQALGTSTSGASNVALGYNTGYYNQTGNYNTLIGTQSGQGTVGNSYANNTMIGYQTGYSTTTGGNNFFGGYQAGYYNTTGTNDSFIGYQAGFNNTIGTSNTFNGYQAGLSNTTNIASVAITNGGSGYTAGALVVDNTGTGGTGFAGTYTVDGSGTINGITITNYGNHYSSLPTISPQPGGAGAILTGTLASGQYNTFVGMYAGRLNTTGSYNDAIGYNALSSNTTGQGNTAISGYNALQANTTGNYNFASGMYALQNNTTGSSNIGMGFSTLTNNTTASNNIGLGTYAGYFNQTGDNNTLIGIYAGYGVNNNSYTNNTFIGYKSGYSTTTGGGNFFGGYQAGFLNTTGTGIVAIGYAAGLNNTANYNTFVGSQSGYTNTSGSGNTELGMYSGLYNQTGGSNVLIGNSSGYGVNGSSNYSNNTFIGYQSGYSTTTGGNNFFGGYQAGYSNATGSENTFLGYSAGYNNTAVQNTYVGAFAGYSGTTGTANVSIGKNASYYNQVGSYNVVVGQQAGQGATANSYTSSIIIGYESGYLNTTGSNNIFVGYKTGYSTTTGGNNTYLGYQSGYSNQTGTGNVFLGYQAGYSETGSNKLYIANSNTATPLIYGDFGATQLTVNGDALIAGTSKYLNFGSTIGTTGYGFFDNGGTMQFKNSAGAWTNLGSVTSVATGSGLSGGPITTTGTISLGALTTDWLQSGAYDIVLSNASSELKIKESAGDTYYGILDVGDLSADATYTIAGPSGNILTSTSEPVLTGGGRHTAVQEFKPEYAGAVLTKFYGGGTETTYTGTMTSDTEGTSPFHNYYNWTSSEAALNGYGISFSTALPSDFDSWTTNNALQVSFKTGTASSVDNEVDVYVYDSSGTLVASSTGNASSTWTSVNFSAANLSGWATAGNSAFVYVRLRAKSSNVARVGEIKLNYLKKW